MKKRNRHAPEQIVKKLRDADVMLNTGMSLEEVLTVLEVSEATLARWLSQYGGMKSEEAKRLKELDRENARLKRLLAEAETVKGTRQLWLYAVRNLPPKKSPQPNGCRDSYF